MISAAKFRYDVTPRRGGVNPMAHYVAGNQARAVEVFLQSGFDPLLPGERGRTPRDHGVRAGALGALAEIDLHLVKRRIEELRRGAEQLREIDDLLGLAVYRHHAGRGPKRRAIDDGLCCFDIEATAGEHGSTPKLYEADSQEGHLNGFVF
jgi:hypothetical protein